MLHFESPIISHSIVGISHRSLNEGLHIIDNSATIPYYLLDTTSQLKIGFMFDVLFEDVTKWKLVLPPLKLVSNYSGFPKTKFKRV